MFVVAGCESVEDVKRIRVNTKSSQNYWSDFIFLAHHTSSGQTKEKRTRGVITAVKPVLFVRQWGNAPNRMRVEKKSGGKNEIRRKKNKIIVEQPYFCRLRCYVFFTPVVVRISGNCLKLLEPRSPQCMERKTWNRSTKPFWRHFHFFRSFHRLTLFVFVSSSLHVERVRSRVCAIQHVISINVYFFFAQLFVRIYFQFSLYIFFISSSSAQCVVCLCLRKFILSLSRSQFTKTHQSTVACMASAESIYKSFNAFCVATENDEYLLSSCRFRANASNINTALTMRKQCETRKGRGRERESGQLSMACDHDHMNNGQSENMSTKAHIIIRNMSYSNGSAPPLPLCTFTIHEQSEKMGIFALAWIRTNVFVFAMEMKACWILYAFVLGALRVPTTSLSFAFAGCSSKQCANTSLTHILANIQIS